MLTVLAAKKQMPAMGSNRNLWTCAFILFPHRLLWWLLGSASNRVNFQLCLESVESTKDKRKTWLGKTQSFLKTSVWHRCFQNQGSVLSSLVVKLMFSLFSAE